MLRLGLYTSRRRLVLQLVMIGIFGCTIAMAYAVRSQRVRNPPVRLDRQVTYLDFTVPVPERWEPGFKTRSLPFRMTYVVLEEPPASRGGELPRTIEVIQLRTEPGRSATDLLAEQRRVPKGAMAPMAVAGELGVSAVRIESESGDSPMASHLYACAVMPDGLSILLDLKIEGRRPDDADTQLLSVIAANIERTGGAD